MATFLRKLRDKIVWSRIGALMRRPKESMQKMTVATIDLDREAAAILAADHHDPFSYLGMHVRLGGGQIVRAFLPDAGAVDVVSIKTGKAVAKMERVHPDGLYIAELAKTKERFDYRLRLTRGEEQVEIEDPFRFPCALGEVDLHLLGEGTHYRSFDKLGAHVTEVAGISGVVFAVWAPNARRVSVIGDFNNWDGRRHPMRVHPGCGIWEIFIPGIGEGAFYKFEIKAQNGDILPLKADPYAFFMESSPRTASVVHDLGGYVWCDDRWMEQRATASSRDAPMSIYEVQLGSWRRKPEEDNRPLSYRELADELVPYVKEMGFTHIELMPVSEFPFEGSWGYQPIGLFAVTNRYGEPDDFRAFIDRCHQEGIGVILDWVVGHFPADEHGLVTFDGTHLYEHADPRMGKHADWDTLIYNFGRTEVANFLLANALFWLDEFHIDALRVDAVASMLYLDYSREEGQWLPNEYGGNENLEAVAFLKRLNELVHGHHPGAFTVAEESTAWPMVSRPTYLGGLGFSYKWNMGWMNDTLRYMSREPVYRKYHQNDLTFSLLYAYTENFILPLSHDEVVHGKGSLIGRMPGDEWQRFANLRLYFTYLFTHPGKKLLFMGGEFGQSSEWYHLASLDWHLLQYPVHSGVQALVRDLNHLYREQPALHVKDCEPDGFSWIECNDAEQSTLSFCRFGHDRSDFIVVVCNFTPVVRDGYRIGVPAGGHYTEILNSDSAFYSGSNVGNVGGIEADEMSVHGHPWSLSLTLPPLSAIVLRPSDS